MTNSAIKYWAVVPAAGYGTRMQSSIPKQYLTMHGKTILEHALAPLLANEKIQKIVVVLAADDQYWSNLSIAKHPKIITAPGGAERCDSELNGLHALSTYAVKDDWVLVHDAARPFLNGADLELLMSQLMDHEVGGLLAAPIYNTIKQVNAQHEVTATIPRQQLWQALTPQMFRYGLLCKALQQRGNEMVTDSSQAIERLGFKPKIIPGSTDNFKITRPADLMIAELLFSKGV